MPCFIKNNGQRVLLEESRYMRRIPSKERIAQLVLLSNGLQILILDSQVEATITFHDKKTGKGLEVVYEGP